MPKPTTAAKYAAECDLRIVWMQSSSRMLLGAFHIRSDGPGHCHLQYNRTTGKFDLMMGIHLASMPVRAENKLMK